MGDSVTPEVEVLSDMIRQYFSQERPEEEAIQALNHLRRVLHEVSPEHKHIQQYVRTIDFITANTIFYCL